MATTRSPAGVHGAARLLATLLAVLLAETLLTGPRRSTVGAPQPAEDAAEAADAVVPSPLISAAAAGSLPGATVAVAVAEQPDRTMLQPAWRPRALPTPRPSLSGPEGERPFPTASLVKLFVAEDVLRRARAGQIALDDRDRSRLREMVRSSDDDAASALWVRFGGGRMVADVAARYGLSGTGPPLVPGRWGQTVTTARDIAVFLARLPVLAHPDDAAALLGWMAEVTPVAADGYDQRFGVLALPGPVAAKQGWMCCVDGVRYLHSVGVAEGRVVVLLAEAPAVVGDAALRSLLDAVAAAVP